MLFKLISAYEFQVCKQITEVTVESLKYVEAQFCCESHHYPIPMNIHLQLCTVFLHLKNKIEIYKITLPKPLITKIGLYFNSTMDVLTNLGWKLLTTSNMCPSSPSPSSLPLSESCSGGFTACWRNMVLIPTLRWSGLTQGRWRIGRLLSSVVYMTPCLANVSGFNP